MLPFTINLQSNKSFLSSHTKSDIFSEWNLIQFCYFYLSCSLQHVLLSAVTCINDRSVWPKSKSQASKNLASSASFPTSWKASKRRFCLQRRYNVLWSRYNVLWSRHLTPAKPFSCIDRSQKCGRAVQPKTIFMSSFKKNETESHI